MSSSVTELKRSPDVPDKIGKYVIINKVGKGSTGTVYLSHDPYYRRDVAIKVYNLEEDSDADRARVSRKMFFNEAHMVGMLQHPNIMPIYDAGEEDGKYYVVTEHIQGARTLAAYCRPDNLLRVDDVVEIIYKVAKALHYAHGRGVIHRDIKPSNVMLTTDNDVRIIDFGIAIVNGSEISRIEGIAGSPSYMSPEQVKGERNLDGRSDLYALGITIYEVLSGRLPFERGGSEFSTMRKIVEDPYPPLSQFVPDLPPGLEAAVMKALEKKPDDRYPNATAMCAAFAAIPAEAVPRLGGAQPSRREAETVIAGSAYEETQAEPGGGARPVASAASKRKLMIGGGVLAVVALAVLAAMMWTAGGSTPLRVSTDPPGAAVYLNGRQLGETPLEAAVEGAGGRLRIERVGYALVDTALTFDAGQPLDLDLALVALAPGGASASVLEVRSSPPGAAVYINDERVGETPYAHRDSTARPLAVRVEREGYQPWIRRGVLLQPDEPTSLHAELQRVQTGRAETDTGSRSDPPPVQLGSLTLNTVPVGGTVSVAGQSRQSGGTVQVPAGSHTIRCGHPQYGPFQKTVQVRAGQTEIVTCYFQATVNVGATTEDGGYVWGGIWVNGEPTGETPAVLTLGPGTYTIMVRRDGYQTLDPSRTVTITPGLEQMDEQVVFRLQKQ